MLWALGARASCLHCVLKAQHMCLEQECERSEVWPLRTPLSQRTPCQGLRGSNAPEAECIMCGQQLAFGGAVWNFAIISKVSVTPRILKACSRCAPVSDKCTDVDVTQGRSELCFIPLVPEAVFACFVAELMSSGRVGIC